MEISFSADGHGGGTLRLYGDEARISLPLDPEQADVLREAIGGNSSLDLDELQSKVRQLHDAMSSAESNLRGTISEAQSAASEASEQVQSLDSALDDAESDLSNALDDLENFVHDLARQG